MQQFGGAAGVAALGTLYFSLLDRWPGDFGSATRPVALAATGLAAVTFGLAFLLPRQPRPEEG